MCTNPRVRSSRIRFPFLACVTALATLVPATHAGAADRAGIHLASGSIGSRDIGRGAIQTRHLSSSTMNRLNGYGPVRDRPRATRATRGWLYFATDVDGGALFRANGRSWDQLTTGRLGGIARLSIEASRLAPDAITSTKLATNSVTARSMSPNAWRAISSSGPILTRPAANLRPAGSLWFAPDVNGGTLYQSSGSSWVVVSRPGKAYVTPDSITAHELASGAVASAQLAPAAVTSDKLAAASVTTTQLAGGAVTTAVLADGSVTAAKLAADAVTSASILDGTITVDDVDASTWTSVIGSGTLAARPAADADNAGHLYFSEDEAGGTLARSDGASWNLVGTAQAPQSLAFGAGTWSNMPSGLTELYSQSGNRWRTNMDLTTAREVRITASIGVAGNGAALLCGQYSTDDGLNWSNFDGTGGATCGGAQVDMLAPLGPRASAWQTIPADARDDVLVRVVGIGGNGALDPQVGALHLQAR